MSNYPPGQYEPPPSQYGQAPPQKKSKVWVWVLAGCGTFLLVGMIVVFAAGLFVWNKAKEAGIDPVLFEKQPAMAVAKFVTAMNPHIELVYVNEEKGLITVREKSTGKTVTVNLEDARNGKIAFTDESGETVTVEASGEGSSGRLEINSPQGTMKMGAGNPENLPGWLPIYPGATITGNYSMQARDGNTGSFGFTTDDTVERVLDFYEEGLEQAGLKVNATTFRRDGRLAGGMISGEDAAKKRQVVVNVGEDSQRITVSVTFTTRN